MGQKTLKVDKIVPEGGILHIDGQVTATSLQETSNPWEPVNDVDIKFNSGNVGVGTDTPTYKLDVHGTANVGVLTTTSVSGDGSGLSNIQTSNIPGLIQEHWTTENDGILYFQNSNVGIATSTPAYKLDVHGTANVGALNVTSISGDGSGLTNIDGSAVIGLVNQWTSDQGDLHFEDGKVGVGKGTPNHTFDVNGNVNATTLSLSDSDVPVYLTSNASAASIVQWAKEIGGDTNIVRDVAIDSNGNTFVTGEYTSSVDVDVGNGVSLSVTNETNVYLIKYNSSGVAEWALNMIGQGNTVTIDSDGNVYISGRYESVLNINVPSRDGNPLIGKLVPTMRGAAFLIKYDNAGVAQWATHVDGTDTNNGDDIGRNLAIDSSGNLYLTGSYSGHDDNTSTGSRAYSADDTTSIQLPGVDNNSAFLVKYNTDGTPQWVKGIDASGNVLGYGVAVDSGSNVFITGEYTAASEVDVGNSKNLPITTDVASFLVKYDTDGTTQWATKIDGSSTDKGVSVVTGKNGDVHLIGNYTSGAIVVSPFITLPDTSGNDTTFLLTYDTQGVVQWATTIDGVGADVVTDSTGTLYITGSYSSPNSNVSSTDGKDITLVTPSGSATFLVEYSPNGILRSSTHIDGTSNESGNALAVDSLGQNVYVSGTMGSNPVIYNSDGTPSGLTLSSGPGFVVKYEISKPLKLNVSSNLEVGTANLFVDTMTGRVGVNTTSPQAFLHTEGNVFASSNLEVGTANLFVDTEVSRVGVRTRVPGYDLDVNGDINFSGDFYKNGVLFTTVIGSTPWSILESDISYTAGSVSIGVIEPEATLHVEGNVYTSSNLEVGGANLFVDTQTSRVGLGTRAPDATLHVEGNVYTSSNLEVGGANLFVDTQTSRVGLGTRAPDATLHVEGNVYASSNLEVGGANLFVDTQTSRVGMGTRAPDATLHVEGNVYASSDLEVGGANLFVDTQTSRVGLGTRAPDATLHVEGNVYASSNLEVGSNISVAGLSVDRIPIVGTGNFLEDSFISKSNGTIVISSDVEILGNISVDGNSYTIESNSLIINDRVIGIANNNTSHELDIGIVMEHPGKNIAIIHHGSEVPGDPHEHEITIGYTQNTVTDNHITPDSNNITVNILGNLVTQNNMTISENLEVGAANLFVNTETSNVGIGTNEPGFTLDVNGDINFSGLFYRGGQQFISSPWTISGNDLVYNTGNVAIGKSTTPDTKLDVVGTVKATSFSGIQASNVPSLNADKINDGTFNKLRIPSDLIIGNDATSVSHNAGVFTISSTNTTYSAGAGLTLSGTTFALNSLIHIENNKVGINIDTGLSAELHVHGNVLASGDVTAASDIRLKTDIKRIEGALDKVCALGGYTFTMNDKPSTGLIAQEVLEVLPEAVHGSEETYYSLAYGNIIGLLVEAVKELKEKIG